MLNQVKLRNLQKLKYENNFGVNCKIKNGKLKMFFFSNLRPYLNPNIHEVIWVNTKSI